MTLVATPPAAETAYAETRRHELRKTRMLMIDGNLAVNSRTVEGGVSARVYDGGYWGFASAPGADDASAAARRRQGAPQRAGDGALRRARRARRCPAARYRGEHVFARPARRCRRRNASSGWPSCTPGARSATRR